MTTDSKATSFIGGSGSSSGATGAYYSSSDQGRVISPLTEVLADLRRKHVAAAGPQLGNATSVHSMSNSLLIDFSIIPLTYAGDVDLEDTARRLSEEDNCRSLYGPRNSTVRKSFLSSKPNSTRKLSERLDKPTNSSRREKETASEKFMILQQMNSGDNGWASRYRRGLASSSHAENLLCSTPHLRHLSAASAYMQGSSGFTSSKNFLSFLLPGTLHSDGQDEITGSSSISSNKASKKKSASSFLDYGTCMEHSRANYEVAMELAAFVRVLAHEMSLEEFAAAESAVFTSIFSMMHSADNSKRLAGVAALDALIGIPSSDEEKKAIKFANNLSNGLRANNVDYEFLAAVSKALGKMAMGASNVDYVEFEVTRALEWLRIERSDRRLAATLTLKELAQNAPTAFYSKTNQSFINGGTNEFIEHIFPVLRDPQPIVRVCAADAISEFLKIVVDRKHRSTTGLLCQIYANTMDGFNPQFAKKKNGENANITTAVQAKIEAAQHASLLIISDLLDHTRDFMLPRFDEVCKAILSLLDHPKSLIRLQIVRLIPRLARRCPGAFGRRYLEKGLKFILESATAAPTPRNGIDIRPASFYSLGQLALSMSKLHDGEDGGVPQSILEIVKNEVDHDSLTANGSRPPVWTFRAKVGDIYANLDAIFSLVKSGLRKSHTNSSSRGSVVGADTRGAALHCGADLVEALGTHAEPYVEKLLNDMFESGLSEDLIHCLHSISECLPSQKPFIEERLLQELSLSLAGTRSGIEIWDPLDTWTNRLSQLSLDQEHVQNKLSSTTNSTRDHKAAHQRVEINMSERPDITVKLVLSLRTLGLFGNLKGSSAFRKILLPFVKDVVAQYLSHPSDEVRREAAMTCCLILLPSKDNFNVTPETSTNSVTPTNGSSSQAFKSLLGSHGIIRRHPGSTSGVLVEEVLQTLLRVAVSDRSPTVRHCVVRSLDLRYDTYMCQAHNLAHLFLILQDEALVVRAAALRLLGNLARINPALILPGLRKFLIDLIIELRCGCDTGGGREAATRLLVVFLRAEALHRLVHPFLPSIIEALPLKGVAPRLASAAMEALGELAQVSRSSLTPWVSQLLPHILETMQDQSSASKQRTSIRTLGLITGGTGYVISPYIDYPNLLSQAADVLPGTKRAPWALRREVIRTFGILGALDPDRYHAVAVNNRKGGGVGSGYFIDLNDEKDLNTVMRRTGTASFPMDNSMSKDVLSSSHIHAGASVGLTRSAPFYEHKFSDNYISRNNDDEDEPAHLYMYELYAMTAQPLSKLPPARRLTPADDEFFPTVAVQALTRILKDPSLAVHHGMVMQAVMFIFNSLGLRCVPFLKGIVPYILQTVRTCGQSSLREALLQQVASLSGIVRDHLRPYVPAIFEIVEEFWLSKHFGTVLVLVDKMAIGVPEDFRRYFPSLLPKLLSSIETIQVSDWANSSPLSGNNSSTSKFERLELVLKSICGLRNTLGEYMHLLIPSLLKLTDSLINPALSSENSSLSRSTSSLAVLSIQTVSILLQVKENELLGEGATKNVSFGCSTLTSSHSLPARAAQPLIRMLGNGSNCGKVAGYAIIDALCVCAKQLGHLRWMPLYHLATQDAIIAWQDRVGISSILEAPVLSDSKLENNRSVTGLQKYDEVLRKILFSTNIDEQMDANATSDKGIGGKPEIDVNWTDTETVLNGNAYDGTVNNRGNELHNLQPAIQPIPNQKNKHQVNQANLQRAWDVTQRTTREDWDEWMRRFAVQLLREAPAPALRATAALAHAYQPLARELFSAAFVCCWSDLNEKYRENLLHSLETAFFGDVSPEILQTLLNLAEFMEHDGVEGGLPIDISILAELALKCRSYAKALHYKEREHILGGGGACTEYLISINKKLDLPEAALGVLKAAQFELVRHGLQSWEQPQYHAYERRFQEGFPSRMFHYYQSVDMAYNVISTADEISAQGGGSWAGAEMQESWLAKLGSWSEALSMYERRLAEDPNSVEAIIGCMRCLDARGEWKRVLDLAKSSWEALSSENRLSFSDEKTELQFSPTGRPTSVSVSQSQQTPQNYKKALKFCAKAAWRLGDWDDLELYASMLVQGKHEQFCFNHNSNNSSLTNGLPRVDYHGAFYSAILHIHRNEWSKAAGAIDATRRAMDSRFTALMAESYKRAYPSMVTAQTLSEMEEIIEFRKLEYRAKAGAHEHPVNRADETEARRRLLKIWRKRLGGCRVDAEVHSDILAVRSLVLGPTDEVESTLTLSALSRQAQCFKLAERVLLDPLAELGADLNGVLFGFDVPSNLKLGLLNSNDNSNIGGKSGLSLDRLVTGDPSMFLPKYGTVHVQFSRELAQSAGGIERLNIQHRLYFAYLKHLWAMDHHEEAMDRLSNLCNIVDMVSHCEKMDNTSLRVDCWLRLGDWNVNESNSPGTPIPESLQTKVLMAYKRSTASPDCGYKAWHAWALINFRLAQQIYDKRNTSIRHEMSEFSRSRVFLLNSSTNLRNHVVAAVQGFVKAISMGTKRWSASVQQDMLNFLTCLFKYGELPEVAATISAEIGAITLEAWLGVLPQLLARIHIKSPSVRSILHPLLTRIGAKHPQALMYPLSVLLKSPVIERKVAAESLMNSLKAHSNALVEEALMVSSELIRVAILWLELWHEGLEDASRLYFGEGNVSGMLEVLIPLHDQLERGPSTKREVDFHKSFGRDLAEAHVYVKKYIHLTTSNGGEIPTQGGFMPGTSGQGDQAVLPSVTQNAEAEAALNQAWDLYYVVFRRINKQLPGLTSLELNQCSPALLNAHNLELGVPGSYRVDGSYVKIERFIPSVQVITSKQRPRKIVLRGSNGKDYVFLLKGHEDLRQDERVMQLFGLVNALLARDRRTNNHDLDIQRYAIAPLSHNAGLVGWVPHCDTIHSLIRDYRESKRIPLNMEHREMIKLSPDYEHLTSMQKIEIFSEALERTTGKGNDLYEVLWIKSMNSEEWLERRTKFTRSLAVMSMVGYILGLGDRHPSNLMLDQISGRILHIDFGDCFEVAMHREKFPEKIPFRLTRMLIKAMEVSGIEGSYRTTCERTMSVLRDNRDSLVAMLEAFVDDPLISWRLLNQTSDRSNNDNQQPTSNTIVVNGNSNSRKQNEACGVSRNNNNYDNGPNNNSNNVDIETSGKSYAQGIAHESIRESSFEDSIDGGDDERNNNRLSTNQENKTAFEGKDKDLYDNRKRQEDVADKSRAKVMGSQSFQQPSRSKSLQMYSNMQAMAASLSTSSRIASLTDGGAERLAVEGSLARSRLDRSLMQKEAMSMFGGENIGAANEEALNTKALKVIRRVQDKLTGTDFQDSDNDGNKIPLDVQDQVQRLIVEATSTENLCQLFIGWCAFW